MNVPLALNDIGIRIGLKEYKRNSSTISHQTDAIGLSALYGFYLRDIVTLALSIA